MPVTLGVMSRAIRCKCVLQRVARDIGGMSWATYCKRDLQRDARDRKGDTLKVDSALRFPTVQCNTDFGFVRHEFLFEIAFSLRHNVHQRSPQVFAIGNIDVWPCFAE